MCESRFDEKVLRPTLCPFCQGRDIDPAVAKTVTGKTPWRCRECERTWTIPGPRLDVSTGAH